MNEVINKKYFIISDIHSFYDEMIAALKKAGYRKTRKDHHLVVLGDVFDRGPKTIEVYKYLQSIPRSRLTLVTGNHEELYTTLLSKVFPESHDFSNGTVRTFCQIAKMPEKKLRWGSDINNDPYEIWAIIKRRVREHEITKWIKNKKIWKDFVEIGKFIGVHSFIPVRLKPEYNKLSWYIYDIHGKTHEYIDGWRTEATKQEWSDARWGCPWQEFQEGLFEEETKKSKVLICGHWHAYAFRENLDGVTYKTKDEINFNSYISDKIIAIDACTVISKQVNVIVTDGTKLLN